MYHVLNYDDALTVLPEMRLRGWQDVRIQSTHYLTAWLISSSCKSLPRVCSNCGVRCNCQNETNMHRTTPLWSKANGFPYSDTVLFLFCCLWEQHVGWQIERSAVQFPSENVGLACPSWLCPISRSAVWSNDHFGSTQSSLTTSNTL